MLFASTVASLIVACEAPKPAATTVPTAVNPLVKPRATGADLTAVQASTELAQSVGGASKGIWVAPATFPEAGSWGAQVTLEPPNDTPKVARMNFDVRPKFSAPGYEDAAVRSVSPTDRDVNGDTSRICTNVPPCALHTQTIAEALEPGTKPLLLLFATPALCTSATCAPELEAVQQLHTTYADQANFIHVEIYQYPYDSMKVAKTVDEWHLPSDPWTFVVDRKGVVRDRFEGSAPVDELEPSLKSVLV